MTPNANKLRPALAWCAREGRLAGARPVVRCVVKQQPANNRDYLAKETLTDTGMECFWEPHSLQPPTVRRPLHDVHAHQQERSGWNLM